MHAPKRVFEATQSTLPHWRTIGLVILVIVFLTASYKLFGGNRNTSRRSLEEVQEMGSLIWKPRLFYYKSILSKEMIRELRELAIQDTDESSTVGKSSSRRSMCRNFKEPIVHSSVISTLNEKLLKWIHAGKEYYEPYCVYKFQRGASYPAEYDFVSENDDPAGLFSTAGQRVATVLVFLSAPKGATIQFPSAANGKYELNPSNGDALLIWNVNPDVSVDDKSAWGVSMANANEDMWVLAIHARAKPLNK